MFQGLGRHLRSVSHFIGKCSLFPVVMDYGLYPPPYRYTADQVPYQNMQVTHTIDLIGATSVFSLPSSFQSLEGHILSLLMAQVD